VAEFAERPKGRREFSTPKSSVKKKTLIAAEQDRPDVARRRRNAPSIGNGSISPAWCSSVIDETWTKTNMAPPRGWAPIGQRIKAKVPHGRRKTMTFLV